MRILIHSLNFWPEPTATGKYTGEMAFWLSAAGHEVDVVAGLPHYPEWKLDSAYEQGFQLQSSGGVRIFRTPHYIPPADGVTASKRILMEVSFILAGLRWWIPILFQKKKYDVAIAVCPPMQTAVLPWIYRILRGCPWVFHIQDFQVDAALRLNMLKLGKFGKVLYWIENFLLSRATAVSTITPAMCSRVLEKCQSTNDVVLFPNWSNIQAIRPSPRENAFRHELGLMESDVLVMYAGAMGDKQGLEVVIDAAAALQENSSIKFAMVGTGANRPRLERMAAERDLHNIRFLPVQPLERLNDMLAASDIQLIVQKPEAADLVMPSKLTNILAAGRASIATAEKGTALADTLLDYDAGLAVPPGNAGHLAQAIASLSADAPRRSQCGRNARKFAEEMLDQNEIMQRFAAELSRIAEPSNRARAHHQSS